MRTVEVDNLGRKRIARKSYQLKFKNRTIIMADPEQKGNELMAEAEKKLKSSQTFLGSLFGGANKVEEAAELYKSAANSYKMAKKWAPAGKAFCEAAIIHLNHCQSKHEAASHFVDAGNCFKKADPEEAVNCLTKAIEIYTDMGRFTIAGKNREICFLGLNMMIHFG